MAKTNKSFTKRLRLTRKGKILGRKAGGNHFNAKEKRRRQLGRRKPVSFILGSKDQARLLGK